MSNRTTVRHADWLALVDPLGPFVTLPVLRRSLPGGLERTKPELRAGLRDRVERLARDQRSRREFTGWVLRHLLGFGDRVREDQAVPATCTTTAERGTHLRPDYAVIGLPDEAHPDGQPRLLINSYPAGTNLSAHLPGEDWAASPVDRMGILCRSIGCQLGLVTDGDKLTLVWASPGGGPIGRATWVASVFSEGAEASLLDSFTTLLGARRFFAAAPENRLEALLRESSEAQAEVTGQLGLQVRQATELLVAAVSRADRERQGALLVGIEPHIVYEAAATVMMRLVFLLYAEERRLLPLGEALYDESYAASTLRAALRELADTEGEETLEHRNTGWPRMLATFRAVYAGLSHDELRVPAYGGGLFDPDRFPFLEGRKPGQSWRDKPGEPLGVDDRTVLGILTALQILEMREGSVTEARRLSFRSLDVEQIGHVYEGLLDHSAIPITKLTLGLIGGKAGAEPEIAVEDLDREARGGRASLIEWVRDRTGKTAKQLATLLEQPLNDDQVRRLLAACDNDRGIFERCKPWASLTRDDLRGLPLVLLPGTFYVTETSHRRDTGTEYTPRVLAEEIVRYTLEPLVYDPGPGEGAEPSPEHLRPSEQILGLRVCDPAVGSGAFLVAACRYLGDRVAEAWTREAHPLLEGSRGAAPSEGDVDDLTLQARRRVAERCLYGVDRDPMAIEMAKLSLWLTTMARERPFSFIDHALKSGDSLLGIVSFRQVAAFDIDPSRGASKFNFAGDLEPMVMGALKARQHLGKTNVVTVRDANEKTVLLDEAVHAVAIVELVADLVVGAALSTAVKGTGSVDELLTSVSNQVSKMVGSELERALRADELAATAAEWLNRGRPSDAPSRHPLHWPLAFPEVFGRGFDAIVGNPPFLGGTKISGPMGEDFRQYIASYIAGTTTDRADLSSFFILRAAELLRPGGTIGMLATQALRDGKSREISLDRLVGAGWQIYRAVANRPWPSSAAVHIAQLWMRNGRWDGAFNLDNKIVAGIRPSLEPNSRIQGTPFPLRSNIGLGFQGSKPSGKGFILTVHEADRMLAANERNRDVVRPYLTGSDLNASPDSHPSRFIIDFRAWSEERASSYVEPFAWLKATIRSERAGKTSIRVPFWQFERRAVELYQGLEKIERCICVAYTSSSLAFTFVAAHASTIGDSVTVVLRDDWFTFACVSSHIHYWWVIAHGTAMKSDPRYQPSRCLLNFPFPPEDLQRGILGESFWTERQRLLAEQHIGLTTLNGLVHSGDPSTATMRDIQVELDVGIATQYGWGDIVLEHGFYETPQGQRFTLSPRARAEVLDRLLELNHQRHVSEGVADVKPSGTKWKPRTEHHRGGALFDSDTAAL